MTKIPTNIKHEAMSREFKPSVRIGKTGLTDGITEEIKDQLKKRKLVKIKINKGIYEREARNELWQHLEQETGATLVISRGNVAVLWLN
ncbi:MAG: YhbY family RNA-binding protein [Candidatus Poseidoniales archaeon]|jgi:RNA-binding protein